MKTNKDKWINYAGELRIPRRKENESEEAYKIRASNTKTISVSQDFALKKDSIIRLQKFEEYVKGRLDAGNITQEDYERRMKRGDFVKYVLHVVPQKEEVDIETNSGWLNNALEIRRRDEGVFYIKATADFAVKKDSFILLKKSSEILKELLTKNIITDQQYEDKINNIKIKDQDGNVTNNFWLIYTGTVPPCNS